MNEVAPTGDDRDTKAQKSKNAKRRLFQGEWIVIILIFLISGLTAFFYTRSELNKMETPGEETQMETPTPAEERI